MKSVCSIHEQAYEVGEHCPYCDFPAEEFALSPPNAEIAKAWGFGVNATAPATIFIDSAGWSGYMKGIK